MLPSLAAVVVDVWLRGVLEVTGSILQGTRFWSDVSREFANTGCYNAAAGGRAPLIKSQRMTPPSPSRVGEAILETRST